MQFLEKEREFIYLPRQRASPRNMTPIAAAMTIDNGLKFDTYTGPFKCKPHVRTTVVNGKPNNP